MRKDITVVAAPRQERGKNVNRRLRLSGTIPAVVYGTEAEPVAVAVNPKEVNKILNSSTGHNTIFNLEVTGKETTPVMIIDWQHDPVRDTLMHIDLKRIDVNKRIRVKVPVHLEGDPKGVKQQGGILEVVNREIEIECLPDDIPEYFGVDVSGMLIGGSARAGEIALSGSMKLMSPPDTVLAHVVALRTSDTSAATAEAAGAAEPEVMKKGKKEEAAAADEKKKK
jgi:large subunit ribosomal protein L25